MKRAAAILLSLIFAWLQVLASARSNNFPGAGLDRSCCSCDKSCCVSSSAPDSQPIPSAPAPARSPHDSSFLSAPAWAWSLPVVELAPAVIRDLAALGAPAVPLFTRHCALLI